MPVQSTHPEYDRNLPEWRMMDDAIDGEQRIKSAGDVYLPKPSGMVEAERISAGNDYLYKGYLSRAQYELWVSDSLRSMAGLVSRLEPEIKLPSGLKDMESNATADGFGLKQLFLRVVRQIISHGRTPLVVNIDDQGKPFFSTYATRNAINWKTDNIGGRQDLTLGVFREFRLRDNADEYSHDFDVVYRVFRLVDGVCHTMVVKDNGDPVEDDKVLGTVGADNRLVRGIGYLPIIYAGSTDNGPDVDEIPLLTMARSAIKSYQLSADYFTSLHYTSHPQPWVSGIDDDKGLSVTGPSAAWDLGPAGSCGYLEFQGAGIAAVRTAMQDQKGAALEAGAKVMDVGGDTESGDAREARQSDQHATLHSIVVTAAEAIEQGLRYAADWMGVSDSEVVFKVKPEFDIPELDPEVLKSLQADVMQGRVSATTYWQYLTTGILPEHDFAEESTLIATDQERGALNLDDEDGSGASGTADIGSGDA